MTKTKIFPKLTEIMNVTGSDAGFENNSLNVPL